MPRTSHSIAFIAFVVAGALLVYPFITALLVAAITSYIFRPFLEALQKRTHSFNVALAIIAALISVPLIVFFVYLAGSATPFLENAASFGDKAGALISMISERISATPAGPYIGKYLFDAGELVRIITQYAISFASSLVRNITFIFLDLAIYLVATYYFLKDGPKALSLISQYAKTLPHDEELMLLSIMTGLKRSFEVLFVSYITMSFITAILAFFGFIVAGVPHAGLLAIISGIFSFLPVFGVWMVYIPAAVYQYFLGNVTSAVFVLLYGLLVLTLATDFMIRPILGSERGRVNPLTILLGFFSGPIIFGAKGVLLGPMLLVTVETVIHGYFKYRISKHEEERKLILGHGQQGQKQ